MILNDYIIWIYLANATVLINHEIDSAYWKEWKLLNLPMGIGGFLILHFPMIFLVLFGLVKVYDYSLTGYIISIFLSITGIIAFTIHTYFLKKGRREFDTAISKFILTTTLLLSIIQLVLTIIIL